MTSVNQIGRESDLARFLSENFPISSMSNVERPSLGNAGQGVGCSVGDFSLARDAIPIEVIIFIHSSNQNLDCYWSSIEIGIENQPLGDVGFAWDWWCGTPVGYGRPAMHGNVK